MKVYKTYICSVNVLDNNIHDYHERLKDYPQASSLFGFVKLINDLHVSKVFHINFEQTSCVHFDEDKVLKVEKVPIANIKKALMLL